MCWQPRTVILISAEWHATYPAVDHVQDNWGRIFKQHAMMIMLLHADLQVLLGTSQACRGCCWNIKAFSVICWLKDIRTLEG
jgi:hypothetical protein